MPCLQDYAPGLELFFFVYPKLNFGSEVLAPVIPRCSASGILCSGKALTLEQWHEPRTSSVRANTAISSRQNPLRRNAYATVLTEPYITDANWHRTDIAYRSMRSIREIKVKVW